MNILIYIVVTISYGAKQLAIGALSLAGIFTFFALLIVPPMASFHAFVDNELVYGSLWLAVTLFVYGAGFKMSNHG